jgi:hypothetical protein
MYFVNNLNPRHGHEISQQHPDAALRNLGEPWSMLSCEDLSAYIAGLMHSGHNFRAALLFFPSKMINKMSLYTLSARYIHVTADPSPVLKKMYPSARRLTCYP